MPRQLAIRRKRGYANGPSGLDNTTYYSNLSDVTIIAPDGLSIEDIKVPNQRAYTGSKPVIPSSLADTPSASLGVDGLMEILNSTLGTKYDLTPSLSSLLAEYISDRYDFGTVYGYLRPIWFDCDLNDMKDSLRSSDLEVRQGALSGGGITWLGLHMAPRRIWDLFSNRVVPWWVALHIPWGISHAWLDKSHRKNVDTPINGHEWPVPIPQDANLDLIRIEMLNLGAEYAWLDVLCLRQEGPEQNERLRVKEWMLDIPTIGNAYVETVVCYFNGLGQPLEHSFDSDSARSWFKRTWTLQETSDNWMIGGDMGDRMLNMRVRERFELQLESVRIAKTVAHWLLLLQGRTSEKDVDKIAALAYLLPCGEGTLAHQTRSTSNDNSIGTGGPTLTMAPAYSALESPEDAWTALVKAMGRNHQSQMLFSYHKPGLVENAWRPSWQQVKDWDIQSTSAMDLYPFSFAPVYYNIDGHHRDAYSYEGWHVWTSKVQGLATLVAAPHKGYLTCKNQNREEHQYEISADHQYLIPDGVYSLLLGPAGGNVTSCVVGKFNHHQTFTKTSVIKIIGWPEDKEEWKSLGATLSWIDLH